MRHKAIVIGTSAGGMHALEMLIGNLRDDFKLPIIIVQHMSSFSENYLVQFLQRMTKLKVKEADEKEKVLAGNIYISPPNYHLLVELDETLSFSTWEKVRFSRPSIDLLFETASDCYGRYLIGIILTGANKDGLAGCIDIKDKGGYIIVQDPKEAEVESMPLSVINNLSVDFVGSLVEISKKLGELGRINI